MIGQQLEQGEDIVVVDDDPAVCQALSLAFSLEGFEVESFTDGQAFLDSARAHVPACVILDVHMPGRSGLEIMKELSAQHYAAPFFVMSGRGDIPMAVDAMRSGAVDFIVKPFAAEAVVARVRGSLAASAQHQDSAGGDQLCEFPGHEQLTRREREVLIHITNGSSNKEAGRRLGISPRTIEVHRAHIMDKLGARNAADLVRIALGPGRNH